MCKLAFSSVNPIAGVLIPTQPTLMRRPLLLSLSLFLSLLLYLIKLDFYKLQHAKPLLHTSTSYAMLILSSSRLHSFHHLQVVYAYIQMAVRG